MKALGLAFGMMGIAAAADLRLTIHMVAMEQDKLTELLDQPGGPSISKAREMVKAGEAKLFDTMMLRAKEGVRARMEANGEVIYPTEYQPSELPNSKEDEERLQRRMAGWGRAFPFMPVNGAWTGEFEVRDVGESLSFFERGDGKISWSVELVRYLRDTVYQEFPALEGEPFRIRFPEFERLDIWSELKPGAWHCAGILTKQKDDGGPGEKIVVFARTERLKVAE